MNIIENYELALQNVKEYFSIPLEWKVTLNIYKNCFWELPEDNNFVFFYVSLEDYVKDEFSLTEDENCFFLPLTQAEKWYKFEDIPEKYSSKYNGKEFTAFLIDDDQYPEDLVFAIFDNNKNLDMLEEQGKIDTEQIRKAILNNP